MKKKSLRHFNNWLQLFYPNQAKFSMNEFKVLLQLARLEKTHHKKLFVQMQLDGKDFFKGS